MNTRNRTIGRSARGLVMACAATLMAFQRAAHIGYAVSNWSALARFVGDGRIEAENNAAERALRAVAIERKNFLHLWSDAGGQSASVIYTLIGTANLNVRMPFYSTVTLFARFLGLSTSVPRAQAVWYASSCSGTTWRMGLSAP